MSEIVTLAGSPAATAKSAAILCHVRTLLKRGGWNCSAIAVRDLPADDLLHARCDSAAILTTQHLLDEAQGVIVSTPIYKAAYSGILKAYLDLLPQNALQGKVVLPLATGGSPAHQLALEYALKPVLAALGATTILQGVYFNDAQIQYAHGGALQLDESVEQRLCDALTDLTARLAHNGVFPTRAVVGGANGRRFANRSKQA